MLSLRTLLVSGRASNLPTVWSNCLAGVRRLGGGGNVHKLFPLLLGATLLYLGGMFLNDALDAHFDSQHRRERPIPSGEVTARTVLQIGVGLLAAGAAIFFWLGMTTGILGIILVGCIVVYDAIHKLITLSPLVMAACRFFLYTVAASTAVEGVTGWAVWCGLALAAYIVGLSFLARKESMGIAVNYWLCLALVIPICLALLMNVNTRENKYLENALLLSAVLALWIVRSLRYVYRAADRNIGRAVSGLLAGIVLVDLLAVTDIDHGFRWIFIALLGLALLFQRFVPAT